MTKEELASLGQATAALVPAGYQFTLVLKNDNEIRVVGSEKPEETIRGLSAGITKLQMDNKHIFNEQKILFELALKEIGIQQANLITLQSCLEVHIKANHTKQIEEYTVSIQETKAKILELESTQVSLLFGGESNFTSVAGLQEQTWLSDKIHPSMMQLLQNNDKGITK